MVSMYSPQKQDFPTASGSAPESPSRTPKSEKNNKQNEKPAGGFFPAFVQEPLALETSHELIARGLFQTACDACAGDKPEQSTTTQEKCDSR